MTTENLACIDLGSNSCRLRIADSKGKIIFHESQTTALAEGFSSTHRLSDEAMKRCLDTLKKFALLMQENHVRSYRAVATAACRMALNGDEFIQKVRKQTGISLEIITPYEEARLNIKGALLNVPKNFEYAVVYDLGGASTEISLSTTQETNILQTISIPLGARNAGEIYDLNDFKRENAERLRHDIRSYTEEFIKKSKLENFRDKACLVATSSTPLRLNAMIRDFGIYDRKQNDGMVFKVSEADGVIEKTEKMIFDERLANPYIGDRASIFIPACVIFKSIYDTLKFPQIIVSLKGAQDAMIEELCHGKDDKICQIDSRSQKSDGARQNIKIPQDVFRQMARKTIE